MSLDQVPGAILYLSIAVYCPRQLQRRIDRLTEGNFGDHKFCQDGVWELRIDFGPGYRVYYTLEGKTIVLLLCGGSKRTQAADVREAVRYWRDYQRRQR